MRALKGTHRKAATARVGDVASRRPHHHVFALRMWFVGRATHGLAAALRATPSQSNSVLAPRPANTGCSSRPLGPRGTRAFPSHAADAARSRPRSQLNRSLSGPLQSHAVAQGAPSARGVGSRSAFLVPAPRSLRKTKRHVHAGDGLASSYYRVYLAHYRVVRARSSKHRMMHSATIASDL